MTKSVLLSCYGLVTIHSEFIDLFGRTAFSVNTFVSSGLPTCVQSSAFAWEHIRVVATENEGQLSEELPLFCRDGGRNARYPGLGDVVAE